MTQHADAIARIFESRSRNSWSDQPVGAELIRQVYELTKLGPTSLNCSPARFRFLVSQDAKQRLAEQAMAGNRNKILTAPWVAIIAYDESFYDQMPKLFPIREGIGDFFAGNRDLARETAFRNSTLQGAYLMVAARLLGLDCGPMSGFDPAGVDNAFFSGTTLRSNFICAIGYANDEPFPRLPRLSFDEAAEIL